MRLRLPTLLLLLLAISGLNTGCSILPLPFFKRGPRMETLGPYRILSLEEVQQVENKIKQADGLWVTRNQPGNAEKALALLRESLQQAPHNTQALWRAARVCDWLAEDAGEAKQKEKQHELGSQGVEFGKHAIVVDSASAEGYYYMALGYAMMADAAPTTGLGLVGSMLKALQKAKQLNNDLDYDGPNRVLGQIYLNAPPWPTSVGDLDEAVDRLEDAADDHPEFPENSMALAEAYLRTHKYAEARKHLNRVLAAQPAPDWAAELPRMQEQARQLLAKIPNK